MKFTNPEHTQIEAVIDGVTYSIPANPANRHYRELVLDTGAAVDPYVAPPELVPILTARQFWLGLVDAGLITEAEGEAAPDTIPPALEALIQGLATSRAQAFARITLRTMTEVRRDDQLTAFLANAYGLSDAQVDNHFRAWASL